MMTESDAMKIAADAESHNPVTIHCDVIVASVMGVLVQYG